ncbi:MAG: MmcQ/YjbR family DNA-binding protein [Pseudomonadota bacterium]
MDNAPPLTHPAGIELRATALGYPETKEDFPWGHSAFKVKGKKVFCFLSSRNDGGFSCSMKLPYRAEDALRLPFTEPTGYGLGRSGWVSFTFGPDDDVPNDDLADWLDESWRAVAPKSLAKTYPPPFEMS